ncbi:DUF5690 family protein [Neolewinella lacunae]|uniref:MFS transporter n=1 Tax=Neolewinella lacunae TaxID=1517758 RepID=A0A923PHQ8_9BACT|nr:DUF5690 family protein [Neolewinella lacunae]MBC6994343.1 hypothetical protein [Neolewinella lacunae]MDN3635810.1 DUF5690 family protein [Neolewinella lacunae]
MQNEVPRHWDRWLTLSAGLAAFGAYFCMYAFRKPFTVATYTDATELGGLDFKVALVIAQVCGYALSKFIGIRVIAGLHAARRTSLFIGLMVAAELALVGFGLVGNHWLALVLLFCNGLPLGMIWGIVFSYLEGRRTTELLAAMLCVSFIVSSGAVKSVGAWIMQDFLARTQVQEMYWMPALTGALFFLPLLGFIYWLQRLPPPTLADAEARTRREPMSAQDRRQFLRKVGPGLAGIVLYYVLITAFRDVRDNFAAEIWSALGYADAPAVFTLAELPIALITLGTLVLGYFVKDNLQALRYYYALIVGSTLLIIVATLAFSVGWLNGAYWMVLMGLGLYLGYVPLNAIYFDRLIAAFRQVATAGFLVYVADASGYAGSVGVLLLKNLGGVERSWLTFFTTLSYVVGAAGCCFALLSWWAMERRLKQVANPPLLELPPTTLLTTRH